MIFFRPRSYFLLHHLKKGTTNQYIRPLDKTKTDEIKLECYLYENIWVFCFKTKKETN